MIGWLYSTANKQNETKNPNQFTLGMSAAKSVQWINGDKVDNSFI